MSTTRARIGTTGMGVRIPIPGNRKAWLVTLLAVPVLVLVVAGLAQVFQFDFGAPSSAQPNAPDLEWREMIKVLNRSGEISRMGEESVSVDALLATPEYFAATRRQPPADATAEPSIFFYLTETTHIDDLPSTPPLPLLRIDGSVSGAPVESVVMADSYHHRSTLLRYSAKDFQGNRGLENSSVVEMVLAESDDGVPGDNVLLWELPLHYSADYSSDGIVLGGSTVGLQMPAVSGVALLAVFGGLLAAMWPCLFQLTAYFIPAMAGMSVQDASTAQGLRPRVGVVRIAFFFVLGFTIVYTLAGAVIGFGSAQLSNMESFYIWQRYLSIGAGVILFALALRVAARARAPLVCKMPILSRKARNGVTSPWESMLVGITFATGCMTCFGSAVLIGMVLYVGLAGSALVGATLLFLFSLGMGIPLVIGAMAMARVLPLLFRVEKVVPWMGLASAILIAGYGILLITGNFMAVSGWFYRLTGITASFS